MKKKVILMIVAALGVFCIGISNIGILPVKAATESNLIMNGKFNKDLSNWSTYSTKGGKHSLEHKDKSLAVNIEDCGQLPHSIQVSTGGFELYNGGKYRLQFDISSTKERTVDYRVQMSKNGYKSYVDGIVNINNKVETVSVDFTMNEENDEDPILAFNLGKIGEENIGAHSIKIDNVKLVLIDGIDIDNGNNKDELNENLIENGTFNNNNLLGWGSFLSNGSNGEITAENNKLIAKVYNCGEEAHSIQVYYDGFKIYKNGKYRLEFDISSTVDRDIRYRIQLNKGDYRGYVDGKIRTSSKVTTVSQEFTMNDDNDLSPRLVFNMGNIENAKLPEHSVKIDNVRLVLLDSSGIVVEEDAVKEEQKIVLNQIGYRPNDIKKVIFRIPTKDKTFRVVSDLSGETIYNGQIYGSVFNEAAGETDSFGDFSDLKTPGTYRIETESLGSSFKFTIGEYVYKSVFKGAMKFFYYQRCGEELTQKYAGIWNHAQCHSSLARIYGTDKKIDVSGGWHDAGDYGRYIVASSKAIADLLSAYNDNKAAFGDNIGIPESGNEIPDVLDEVKLQLKWMLKMQESSTGGVYHKVTTAKFTGYIRPDKDADELIVSPVSTTATGDFAAVMAMGYENFKNLDPDFAKQCLSAAKKAWTYLEKTDNTGGFKNPSGIVTGEYSDKDDSDERYWAAAQLFKVTGDNKYNEAFKSIIDTYGIRTGYDWSAVGNYGSMAYLSAKGADEDISKKIKKYIISTADYIIDKDKSDPYGITNGNKYSWGSNMNISNNGVLLTKAYKINPNPQYLEYAKEHLNYCLGKNPVGMSYITGYGTDSPRNPHHRLSMVAEKAVPGMMVGGANMSLNDAYSKEMLKDKPPAQCYIDHAESYSTNEVDIYWNSSFVYLMSQIGIE